MLQNPEDILVALLSLNSIYRRRISPQTHHNLVGFVQNFFERQIDLFGHQPITYPIVRTSIPVELALDKFVREEYIASRQALLTAWSVNPLQWDVALLSTCDRQPHLALPSVVTRLWDLAFFTDVRSPAFRVGSLIWLALAYQSGLEFQQIGSSEETSNPFAVLAGMVHSDPTFQARVFNIVNKYNTHSIQRLRSLQEKVKNGIEWVVGARRLLFKRGIYLILLRIISHQAQSQDIAKQVRSVEDSLDEGCADLGQTILLWPTIVKFIFHDIAKLSKKEKRRRIDYWYSRGHIPEFTRQALMESSLRQPQDCLRVPPIYINAVKLLERETQENIVFQMINDKEELEHFMFNIIGSGVAVLKGVRYSFDELFPNDGEN